MKLKFKGFKRAMSAFQHGMPDNAEIEIDVRVEDFNQGMICDNLTLVATWQEEPSKYDDNRELIEVVQTIEMFTESENRPFRVTTTKSRNIK